MGKNPDIQWAIPMSWAPVSSLRCVFEAKAVWKRGSSHGVKKPRGDLNQRPLAGEHAISWVPPAPLKPSWPPSGRYELKNWKKLIFHQCWDFRGLPKKTQTPRPPKLSASANPFLGECTVAWSKTGRLGKGALSVPAFLPRPRALLGQDT